MRGKVKIGPWRTTNLISRPTELRDDELAYTENIVIDDNGGIRPRPAFRTLPGGYPGSGYSRIVGVFFGELYVVEQLTGPFSVTLRRYNFATSSWTTTTGLNTGTESIVETAVSYGSEVYFICSKYGAATKGGFRYNPGLNTQGALPNQPLCNAGRRSQKNAFIYKDRMWIIKDNTVSWSKATDPTDWTVAYGGGGFIKIDEGQDSSGITAYAIKNDVIYFFKLDKTYAFNFYTAPDVDGQMRRISSTRGARFSAAVSYNNRIFCYDDYSVWEIVGNDFVDIGASLGFHKFFYYKSITGLGWNALADTLAFQSGLLHLVNDFLVVGPLFPKGVTTIGQPYGDSLLQVEGSVSGSWLKPFYAVCNLKTGSWFLWSAIVNSVQGSSEWNAPIGEWFRGQDDKFYSSHPLLNQIVMVDLQSIYHFLSNRTDSSTVIALPDEANDGKAQYPPYRFTTKTFDFGSLYQLKKVYRIFYNRYIKALLPSYTNSNYDFKIQYNLTNQHLSRVVGHRLDSVVTNTNQNNFGLLPGSQARVNAMSLGMEFKMLTNTNAGVNDKLTFLIDGFDVELDTKNTESITSTL